MAAYQVGAVFEPQLEIIKYQFERKVRPRHTDRRSPLDDDIQVFPGRPASSSSCHQVGSVRSASSSTTCFRRFGSVLHLTTDHAQHIMTAAIRSIITDDLP